MRITTNALLPLPRPTITFSSRNICRSKLSTTDNPFSALTTFCLIGLRRVAQLGLHRALRSELSFHKNHEMVVTAPLFDFSTTPLSKDYTGFYVKVVDDVFTAAECASLISLAESDQKWSQAAVHYGLDPSQQYINTDYRNSERILRFDADAAKFIYERLLPLVPELIEIKPEGKWETIVGSPGRTVGVWKLIGINERLSFLRYGPGNYFKGHCDGQLSLPDGRKSRVTLQVYLNDEGLSGGATRLWSANNKQWVDIEPKLGRILVFQQRGLWHSGEEVTNGVKYALRSDFLFTQELVYES